MQFDDSLVEIVRTCIPDVDGRKEQFIVDTSEVDDELLEIFFEQMDINVNAMKEARANSDMPKAAAEAHSIKGMGGTIGIPELSVLAAELESSSKANDLEKFDALMAALDHYFVVLNKLK